MLHVDVTFAIILRLEPLRARMSNVYACMHEKKGRWRSYLRFLNSFIPSLSVTYWNPFSISFASSSIVLDVRLIHESSSS
jgi:hypothetical protein